MSTAGFSDIQIVAISLLWDSENGFCEFRTKYELFIFGFWETELVLLAAVFFRTCLAEMELRKLDSSETGVQSQEGFYELKNGVRVPNDCWKKLYKLVTFLFLIVFYGFACLCLRLLYPGFASLK